MQFTCITRLMLKFKITGKLLVKRCCSCPKDEGIKDIRDNGRKKPIGVLKYKNVHRNVPQENYWQVRRFSVLPCHS